MFYFTPLLGAKTESCAVQSLLEFDGGIKVLIDVGWDIDFDAEALKELERQVPTISIVLLTHPNISHLGAYAHCCKHIPLFSRIPVYATTPVVSLGRTLLQDLYASTPLASSLIPKSALAESAYSLPSNHSDDPTILLPPPSNEEIGEYFALINQLKYLQPHQPVPSSFSPPLNGLTVTAHCSGHTLGGTIWHIQHASESIVYAVDWNQAREQVLPGAAWLGGPGAMGAEIVEQLRKPTALICSSKGASDAGAGGSRQQRDEQLIETIRTAIRSRGNVLIPCDSSARVLELAYMLERAWESDDNLEQEDSLHRARLYFASPTSGTTMRYARSMPEWMDENIIREFEAASSMLDQPRPGQKKVERPFDFKFLKLIERKSQLERALESEKIPKIILASDTSLSWGFSQTILQHFSSNPNNIVVLTDRLSPSTTQEVDQAWLSRGLWEILEKKQNKRSAVEQKVTASIVQCENDKVNLRLVQTGPLAGAEQSIYQQYLARQRQRQNTIRVNGATDLENAADMVDEQSSSSSSSSEDSDDEHQGKALNASAALTSSKNKIAMTDEELGINILLRKKDVHDFDTRGRKGRDRMFPFVGKRKRADDFGTIIRPEEYVRAEEREDNDGNDAGSNVNTSSAVGSKRKWDELESQDPRKRGQAGTNKRRKSAGQAQVNGHSNGNDLGNDTADESDESDYEPAEPVVKGPTRAIISFEDLSLKLKIAAVDLSGLHDKRSLHMLIPLIRPRKLILTAGDEQETTLLATDCDKLLRSERDFSAREDTEIVLAPSNGTTVDASVDTNAWTIKLNPAFLRDLHWQKFRGLGIVTVSGQLDLVSESAEESSAKRQKVLQNGVPNDDTTMQQGTVTAMLSDVPSRSAGASRSLNQALHVGDLRLAELRKILQGNGHTAEFKGEGTLLVDGLVTVRKSGIGKIEVESNNFNIPGVSNKPDSSFSNVKRRIYEGLAIVAAR